MSPPQGDKEDNFLTSIGRIKSDDECLHNRIDNYYGNVSMSDIGRSLKLSAILKWQANGCQNMWEPQVLRPNCEECHPMCWQFASSKTWSPKVFRCQTDAATGPSEKLAWQTLSIPQLAMRNLQEWIWSNRLGKVKSPTNFITRYLGRFYWLILLFGTISQTGNGTIARRGFVSQADFYSLQQGILLELHF